MVHTTITNYLSYLNPYSVVITTLGLTVGFAVFENIF